MAIGTGMLVALMGMNACHFDPNVRKQKYFESGMRYNSQGKYNEAAIQFANALKSDGDFVEAHLELARAYAHLGQFDGAYNELTRVVALQPSNCAARVELGSLLIAAGNIDGAQQQADAISAVQPDNPDLHGLLSAIAMRRGETDKARNEIERALALDPNRPAFHEALAIMDSKNPLNSASVESELKRAIVLDPHSANARLLLAAFYSGASRWAEAEQTTNDVIAMDRKNVSARQALAQIFLQQNNPAKAEDVLRSAGSEFANDPNMASMLADYYERSGQYDKAKTEFTALADKFPKNLFIQESYVRCLIEVKDYAAAQSVLGKLMKTNGKDPHILALNGIVLLNDGHVSDAVYALQTASKEYPKDSFILYWLGKAALANHDSSLAEASFTKVTELMPSRLDANEELAKLAAQNNDMQLLADVADKTIAAAPRFALGFVWRASVEITHNEPAKAEADLKTAMNIAPQSAAPHLLLGRLRIVQKRNQEGIGLIEQALQLDPDSTEAARILVSNDLAQQHPEKALARINALIALRPQHGDFYDILSQLQAKAHNWDAAAEAAQKAIQLNAGDAEAVMLYAQIEVQQGHLPHAIAAWEAWYEAHPGDAAALALLGMLEEARRNPDKAESYYKKALQIQPNQAVAANNLAYMMLQNGGNADVALSLAQTARRGMPDSPNAADTLAWAYYQKGAFAFARDLLEEALKKDATNATMQFHLGMVYSKLTDKRNAILHLKRAITLAPDSPSAKDATNALNGLS